MVIFGHDGLMITLTPAKAGLIHLNVVGEKMKTVKTDITLQQAIEISNQFRRYAVIMAAGISPEGHPDEQ